MGPSGAGAGGGVAVIDPGTLDEGHGAVGLRLAYTRPHQRSDAELEALADRGIGAHNTDYNLNASLGVAYGITHELTVAAELPYVRRDHLREGEQSEIAGAPSEVVQLGDVAGVGDLSLLAKYRVMKGADGGLSLIAGVKAPTGGTHVRGLDGERLETEHQPGTGSWDPILGASAGARLGAIRLSLSALYQFAGNGAQHTRLGDRAQAGIAFSHRFGEVEAGDDHDDAEHGNGPSDHHHHDHAATHAHASWEAFAEVVAEWEGRQTVDGEVEEASGGTSVWVTPGVRFNSANDFSVALAAGVPAWQDIRPSHPRNDYRLLVSLSQAF
jgi:hypothetical protein